MNENYEVIISKAKEISPELVPSLEVAFELIPFAGKLYSGVKLFRLNKRVDKHSDQIKRIARLNSSGLLSAHYIDERIFPIVLEDLIEEHEESKIQLILNGFENTFIEKKNEESVVLNYFDTLRSLRYLDIKRLLYLAGESNEYNFVGQEEKAITLNVDIKLQNQGLIGKERKGMTFGGGWEEEKKISKEDVLLYSYCKHFLEFILIKN